MVRVLEREVEADSGLPLSWYDVLLELAAADEGRLRMQDLAGRVVLSRTRVSRLVGEIAAAGLVDRIPDSADGRATFTIITDRGHAQLHAAAPVYLAGIRQHFTTHLSAARLTAIRDGLAQVLAAHDGSG